MRPGRRLRSHLARGVAIWIALGAAQAGANGDPPHPAEPAGAALYTRFECAGCHEQAARPGMIVRRLAGLSERYSDASLAAFLAAPPPEMPLFPMSDGDRADLAAWLRGRFP